MADRRNRGIQIVVDKDFYKMFKDIRATISKQTNVPFKSDKNFSAFLVRANMIQIKEPRKRGIRRA